jgi:hypothetical protein
MSRLILKGAPLAHNFQNCGFLSVLPNCLATKAKLRGQNRFMSGIVQSPLGPCKKIPNENIVEHIYKNNENWIEEPAAVSMTSKCGKTRGFFEIARRRVKKRTFGTDRSTE